jgi:hypothetical protein
MLDKGALGWKKQLCWKGGGESKTGCTRVTQMRMRSRKSRVSAKTNRISDPCRGWICPYTETVALVRQVKVGRVRLKLTSLDRTTTLP